VVTCVLLLDHAVDVGGVSELGLDFLLAVPEIVVGNESNHAAVGVAGSHLAHHDSGCRIPRCARSKNTQEQTWMIANMT
jgi:hypothetical protein